MIGATIRRSLVVCAVAIGLAFVAAPASAQTGQVKGKVVDKDNKPVEGATINIENQDGAGQKLATKTDKKGQYIQIGLTPGKYKITATKGDLSQTQNVQIHLDMAELNFTLMPAGQGQMSKEDQQKMAAKLAGIRAKFDEAVAFSNAGKDDEAIAKFQEIAVDVPKCAECFANIGTIYARKKDYDNAEKSYKQAIEARPDFAEAYNGLATVYNAEKKFDQAAEASAQAAKLSSAAGPGGSGGNASAVFNQGVILWNAQKIPEAKAKFEEAVKLDPNLADAHYWLGMSLVNEGKLPDAKPHFEQYLKLAPSGQYAEQAKSVIAAIK
jgi:tetratricopeptide (TPR) repeat protein